MLRDLENFLAGSVSSYERAILRHGAVWFFLLLCSYYILRPIREQIGATYGTGNLSGLFTATFVVMLIAIPVYSFLVGKFRRVRLVPSIYVFFVACLVVFWLSMKRMDDQYQIWVARAFFVWISVFGLFIVSFFWSVAGDMLSTQQGRRIFGIISGGGTIGGLVGSQIAGRLVGVIGVENLLLVPAALLVVSLAVYFSMERAFAKLAPAKSKGVDRGAATGGNPFAGFTAVFQSRYLFAICLFGVFLATCGTSVYFQQAEIVKAAFAKVPYDASSLPAENASSNAAISDAAEKLQTAASKAASTEYFANVNFAVSLVTLVFQFFVVGWLMRNVGIGWTLAMLPLAYICGISALALSPSIYVLAVVSVIGRAAEYGISNPAREVLFTAVEREDRYKAKSFIDTVVRRGGDSAVGSVYQYARETMGFAMTTLSWAIIPLAGLWAALSLFIGLENRKITESQSGNSEGDTA